MRSLFVVVAGLALASAIVLPNVDPLDITFVQFQEFTHQFNKTYDSPAEYENRFMIFSANMARVMELRSEHKRATGENAEHIFGVTKFADLTAEEFAMYKGFTPRPRSNRAIVAEPTVDAPSSIDWRTKGVVTPVKNQDQCGSCWAFSATEEIESRWAMQGNTLTKLSVQQIVSCDTVDQGCNGGDTPTAYQYVQQAGGLELDSAYPYTSGGGDSGTCKDHKQLEKVNVKNYSYATPPCTGACDNQSEPTMEANLATYGPLSICVNANDAWQMYTSGILSSGCSHAYSDLDHCVQVVGYNKAHSTPYWIVRNSWDVTWGVEGYIYIAMGHNLCGIADEATFVHTIKA